MKEPFSTPDCVSAGIVLSKGKPLTLGKHIVRKGVYFKVQEASNAAGRTLAALSDQTAHTVI